MFHTCSAGARRSAGGRGMRRPLAAF